MRFTRPGAPATKSGWVPNSRLSRSTAAVHGAGSDIRAMFGARGNSSRQCRKLACPDCIHGGQSVMVRMSGNRLWSWSALVMALVVAVMSSPGTRVQARGLVRLEIFSSWTWGSEAEGLKALVQAYEQRHAGVEVVNVATAGSATTNDMAILTARMLGGNPPDSFQAHGGEELASTWVTSGYVEPLTPLYEREGWAAVLPKSLLNIVTYKGDQYSVPVSVHRGNVLWYNKKILDENKLAPPTSWDEFFKVASALRAKSITPLALGDKNKWEAAHLFEDVLLGALGPIGYRGLWNGKK